MQQVEQNFFADLEKLDNLSYDYPDSLVSAADQLGVKVMTSELFTRSGGNGVLANPKVISAAFSDEVLKQSRNSPLIELGDTHALVLRVHEHKPSSAKPISEVRQSIISKLKIQKARARASEDASQILKDIEAGADVVAIAKKNSNVKWNRPGFIERQADPKSKVTVDSAIRSSAFEINPHVNNKPVGKQATLTNGDSAVVVLFGVKNPVNKTKDEKTLAQPDNLNRAIEEQDYTQFINQLRNQAEIVIAPIQTENVN